MAGSPNISGKYNVTKDVLYVLPEAIGIQLQRMEWTQRQLAEVIMVNHSTISNFISRKTESCLSTIVRLVEWLSEVDPDSQATRLAKRGHRVVNRDKA